MHSLMDRCRNHYYGKYLLATKGEYQGRFIFPFGHFAVLSNMTADQLANHHCGDLTQVFPANKVVTRDVLQYWVDEEIAGEKLANICQNFFNPFWEFPPLNPSQIDALRSIIHPEILLSVDKDTVVKNEESSVSTPVPLKLKVENEPQVSPESAPTPAPRKSIPIEITEESPPPEIKVLDLRQENNARRIGQGHRIIYGVAGSGKTVLLIAKARLLSDQQPEAQILFLCYNVTLAAYLRDAVRSCTNVTVRHFDGWAKANNCVRRLGESNEEFGERFLLTLENGCNDSYRYDAILIDEAQDFAVSWYKCCLAAMQDPNDGDLIIVGDGSQGLYGRRKISWNKIGINARGRTISERFNLDKNYRNVREIVELAAIFSTPPEEEENQQEAESIRSLFVDPQKCSRRGVQPVLVKSKNRRDECTVVLSIVKNLLDGKWFGKSIDPLKPEEIAIFYPLAYRNERPLLQHLVEGLGDLASVIWLTDPDNRKARNQVNEPGIKVQTIYSAKGLQYRAVILMWADHLPRQFENTSEAEDRCLMYVGITRPEDYLVISASDNSKFIREIENSRRVEFA